MSDKARQFHVRPASCPNCLEVHDATTVALGDQRAQPPEAGDITMCINCKTWLVYTAELLLRNATPQEIAHIPADLATAMRRGIDETRRDRAEHMRDRKPD